MSNRSPIDGSILAGVPFGDQGRARNFTWGHILFRACWNTCWFILAAWTPPQMYGWRRWLLNRFGATIAPGARVYSSARIWYPPNLKMGRFTVLGPRTVCYCQDRIVMEDFAEVAQYVHLVTGTHDIDSATFQLRTRPIHIGRYAWIASRAFVGPGVIVNEGAVLGACGVAFRDLDPWTVYLGNPAQAVRKRNNFVAESGTNG